MRVHFAKRSRLRFTSHRDFARAFERALRRAGVPVAFSAGFSPHPKVSYLGAVPTGAASEAEYLEIGLAEQVDCDLLRAALDGSLPPGLDIVECVPAGPGALADRIDTSTWRIDLPGAAPAAVRPAVTEFLGRQVVEVERLTKNGRRRFDARAAVVRAAVHESVHESVSPGPPPVDPSAPPVASTAACAILDLVVRQVTPAVRPDDVLAALRAVAGFVPPAPPLATRMAQGRLDDNGRLADPLAPDRAVWHLAPSVGTTPVG